MKFDFSTYTTRPYARHDKHNTEKNGQHFREEYLEKWMQNDEVIELYIPELELVFSDSFVDESFYKIILKYGYETFKKKFIITGGEYADDLLETIEYLRQHSSKEWQDS